uniref:C2H2-type domain-containing protein n=1 Tax=Cacopsylla melanoneura TaxID=428564 RepID=A0A8D8T0Z8_9HEMI
MSYYHCPTCYDYITKRQFNLRRHMETCSSLSTYFNCAHCNFKSTNRKLLTNHIKGNHLLTYRCEHCEDFITNYESNFMRHKKQCKGEKAVPRICGQTDRRRRTDGPTDRRTRNQKCSAETRFATNSTTV